MRGSGNQTSAETGSWRCGGSGASRRRPRGRGWRPARGQEGGVSQADESPSDKNSHSYSSGDSEQSLESEGDQGSSWSLKSQFHISETSLERLCK